MHLATFVCILGQILLFKNVFGSICEEIEDLTEGEIIVSGDEVICDGLTEVDGNVPMTGNVVFEGPVRAAGKVTIVGSSGPMLSGFGLGPSLRPPMLMPSYYFPYPIYSNIFIPVVDNDRTIECGYMDTNNDNLSTVGETLVEGTVPIAGNICYAGVVPVYALCCGSDINCLCTEDDGAYEVYSWY